MRCTTPRPSGSARACTCSGAATGSASSPASPRWISRRARPRRPDRCRRRARTAPRPRCAARPTSSADSRARAGSTPSSPGVQHGTARVVAHLPSAVRYAAVTSADGVVVVAGGSLPNGTASDRIWTFDPRSGRVRTIGRLPEATTHGAAAAIGGTAFVIGGAGRDPRHPDRPHPGDRPEDRSRARRRAAGGRDLGSGRRGRRQRDPRRRGPRRTGHPLAGRPVEAGCSDHAHDVPPDAHALTSVYAHDGANMLLGAGPLRAAAHLRPEQRVEHGRRHRSEHVPRRRATTRSARCPSTSRRPGT